MNLQQTISSVGLDQYEPQILHLSRPSIRLIPNATDEPADPHQSRLGGLPHVPRGFAWPIRRMQALGLVAQINLRDLPADLLPPEMPTHGQFYFFNIPHGHHFGFHPDDRGWFSVIYDDHPPDMLMLSDHPPLLAEDPLFTGRRLRFEQQLMLPGVDSEEVTPLGFDARDRNHYLELLERIEESQPLPARPLHRMLGYPDPMVDEGDMRVLCELVESGADCSRPEAYDPQSANMAYDKREDWILLLQVDSDPSVNMDWFGDGRLYYWIRRQHLAERRFDRAWMTFQRSS